MKSSRPVVIVMVKTPVPGTVKTRLTPALSSEDAAGLATAFVADVISSVLRTGAALIIAYAPADGRAILEALLPDGLEWAQQQGRSLGERIDRAMTDAQARGFGPLIVVGTDSPTLPPARIQEAVATLKSGPTQVVLGPTEDGGYYLVGTKRHVPGLFDGVAWSTELAFTQTAANAARLGLRCRSLTPWYDIDTPDDLYRLQREMKADEVLRGRLPATADWLRFHPEITAAPVEAGHPRTNA